MIGVGTSTTMSLVVDNGTIYRRTESMDDRCRWGGEEERITISEDDFDARGFVSA